MVTEQERVYVSKLFQWVLVSACLRQLEYNAVECGGGVLWWVFYMLDTLVEFPGPGKLRNMKIRSSRFAQSYSQCIIPSFCTFVFFFFYCLHVFFLVARPPSQ